MSASFDTQMMARAIGLARRGVYSTRPNPAVGCVLVRDEVVIGEGFTRPAGGNHAEIEALSRCDNARGATAYVTLEPCNHHGKTGPCTEALIAAGISSCVIAMRDPNPQVAGRGVVCLQAAGVSVREGVLQTQAETINPGFYQRMRRGTPLVRVKLASSLDGRTAMASGESQWITGTAARADVQKLRGLSGAILTGIETVLADNPAMTVRAGALDIPDQPLRVIVDSQLRTPADAQILQPPGTALIAYANAEAPTAALLACGAELVHLPGENGRVDLLALLQLLAGRQVNDILVECGPRLAGALVAQGLVDELVVYMAPTLLGSSARPLLDLPIASMDAQRRLHVVDVRQIGADFRYTLREIRSPD